MNFEITTGKIPTAIKCCIYGMEGIGKSTLASKFPEPLFIDTEGSTKHMNVRRLPAPQTWEDLMQEIQYVISTPDICKTLVIDTADWAEKLATKYVLTAYADGKAMQNIEDFGYGKGYVFLEQEFHNMLNMCDKVIAVGINVVITAHAIVKTFYEPDGFGQYDRYELKLLKKDSPLLKEWADMLLFANYKTRIVKDQNGKAKGQGGERVLYTNHSPAWDAKNRFDLPDMIPFDYSAIAHIIDGSQPTPPQPTVTAYKAPIDINEPHGQIYESPAEDLASPNTPYDILMTNIRTKGIDESEVREFVGNAGITSKETPISEYDSDLLAYLNQNIDSLYTRIVEMRNPLG